MQGGLQRSTRFGHGHARREAEVHLAAVVDERAFDHHTLQATQDVQRRTGIDAGQQQDEFIPTVAAATVAGAQLATDGCRKIMQGIVTGQRPLGIVDRLEVIDIQQGHGQRPALPDALGLQLAVCPVQTPAVEQRGRAVHERVGIHLAQLVREVGDVAFQFVGPACRLLQLLAGVLDMLAHVGSTAHDVTQHLGQAVDVGHTLDALDEAIERIGIGHAGVHQLGQVAHPLHQQLFQFGQCAAAQGQQVAMFLQVVANGLANLFQFTPVHRFGLHADGPADGRELFGDPGLFAGQNRSDITEGFEQCGERDDQALATLGQAAYAGQFGVFVGFDDAIRKTSPRANHRHGGGIELLFGLGPCGCVVFRRGRQSGLRQVQQGRLGKTDVSPAFAFSLQVQTPFTSLAACIICGVTGSVFGRGLRRDSAKACLHHLIGLGANWPPPALPVRPVKRAAVRQRR